MNTQLSNIFAEKEINALKKKLSSIVFNSATKGKCKYTRFELFPLNKKNSLVSPLISVYDIFIDENTYHKYLNLFLNENQTENKLTIFEYNNMKLIKTNDNKSRCECHVEEEILKLDNYLPVLINIQKKDIADFSCKEDLNIRNLSEIVIKISSKAPIYLSFIHDEQIEKYYLKLWFDIVDNIDDILDNLFIN